MVGQRLRLGAQERVGNDHRCQKKREEDGRHEPVLPYKARFGHLGTFQCVGGLRGLELVGIDGDDFAGLTGLRIGRQEKQRPHALPCGERQALNQFLFGDDLISAWGQYFIDGGQVEWPSEGQCALD